MEGEVTNSTPSAADLDTVAAEQQAAQDTSSATTEVAADPKVAEAEAYVEARGYDPDAAKRIVAQFGAEHFLAEKARVVQGNANNPGAEEAAQDTGDQISKAVEPTLENPTADPDQDQERKQKIEDKFWPAQPPVKEFVSPAPEDPTPGERLAKLEADFAALVKVLDEQYGIRPQGEAE